MHLTGGIFESIIPRTIDELERLKPRFLVPCHCSGLKAVNEIARNMSNAFIQNSVGTTISSKSELSCYRAMKLSCFLLSIMAFRVKYT